MVPASASLPARSGWLCNRASCIAAGAYFAAATIAACMSSRFANGRFSQALSAIHGEFSKMPPNFWTKAARSIALIDAMSTGPAIATAIMTGPSNQAPSKDDSIL
jgi:hypothetical protein